MTSKSQDSFLSILIYLFIDDDDLYIYINVIRLIFFILIMMLLFNIRLK